MYKINPVKPVSLTGEGEWYYEFECNGLKYIPETKGYFAAVSGDIFKVKFKNYDLNTYYFEAIKPTIRKDGYCIVSITYTSGIHKSASVHRLVARAFLGKCPKNYEVDHKDHIRWHNSIDNLRYISRSENRQKNGSYDLNEQKKLFKVAYGFDKKSPICLMTPQKI